MATRDDYENEELYTKMTRHYNVNNFKFYTVAIVTVSISTEFELFKYTIKGDAKKQIEIVRSVGKGRVWEVKCNMYVHMYAYVCVYIYIYIYITLYLSRVLKGIGHEIIAGESETLVAVKMLKGDSLLILVDHLHYIHSVGWRFSYLTDFLSDVEGASDEDKKDFLGEAQLLSQFNHPNVLSLLGVVTIDDPVLVITPYMKNGDLHSFLTR